MKNLLLVRAKSRLGLFNNPNGQSDKNVGVEEGPDFVLSSHFVNELTKNYKVESIDYNFSQPEDVSASIYFEVMRKESEELSQLIRETLGKNEILVTVGGDHSISLATFHAIYKTHIPSKVGFIQIDSHADIHLVSTSPSGNFHGMYIRPLFGKFDYEPIDKMFTQKLSGKNLMYIGNLDIEPEESKFIQEKEIRNIDKTEIESKKEQVKQEIENFVNTFEHIHLGIDVDAFDKKIVQATGIPAENGLTAEDIYPLLQIIKDKAKSISIDFVEVNPKKTGAKETIDFAQELLRKILV